MTDLEKALTLSVCMDIMFKQYKAGELNKRGELVRSRNAKFLKSREKTNIKIFVSTMNNTLKKWNEIVNHFAEENMKIEAKATISAIFNYSPELFKRFANITDKHIESFMIISIDDYEAEKNSSIVVDYLMNDLGFEKKKSLFMGKRNILKNNLIIEGKTVKEGF